MGIKRKVSYRSILEGNPPGRLFWYPDPEDFIPPEESRSSSPGTRKSPGRPFASRGEPWLLTGYDNLRFTARREGDADVFKWETPLGTLGARRESNHMTEYPLKKAEDIAVWRYVQENLVYARNPAFTDSQRRQLWKMNFNWSPLQELLQFETGIENFYFFSADAPEEMRSLIETMHRKNLEALSIGFESCGESTVFQLGENTSASILSPEVYRKITIPHVRAYGEKAHERGMKFIVHMCGHLRALLPFFAETGMDGIHSVTPPPVGDTPYTAVRDCFGDGFIIVGRLNAQMWMGKSFEDVLNLLGEMIPERLARTPFALWITADEMRPRARDVSNLRRALDAYNGNSGFLAGG